MKHYNFVTLPAPWKMNTEYWVLWCGKSISPLQNTK